MPETVILDKSDVKQLFADSGISNEKLDLFDKNYEHTMYESTDVEENEIDKSHLVETRMIDEIPYITIQVDGVIELNGVAVRPDDVEKE